MSSDPYHPPRQETLQAPSLEKKGPPCPKCQSLNTTPDDILRLRPNILWVIFFGWIFILIQTAFSSKKTVCRDCGQIRKERTVGANIALIILVAFILLFVMAYLGS